MTTKQYVTLDFIKRFIAEKNYAPTIREIMVGLGLKSTSSIQDHLNALTSYGLIDYKPGKSRTIELLVQNEYALNTSVILKYIGSEDVASIPSHMIDGYDVDKLYLFKDNNSIYVVSRDDLNKIYNLYRIDDEYIVCDHSDGIFVGSVILKIESY